MSESTIETQVPVDDQGGENEDDVVDRLSAQRANVTAADWTIETIVTQLLKGRIDLDPAFQRRAAWTPALKSKFIESCILGYPIPQIVLAEHLDQPGRFLVIDGKQRLLALRQFYAGLPDHKDDSFNPYRLSTLTVLTSVKNFGIDRIKRERPDLFDAFETHTIRTVVVRNWGSDDFLYALFLRLNTGSVPLSPQELRQALVPGPFVSYIDEMSGDSVGLRSLLGNAGPDRRMVDAEILTRLVGLFGSEIAYKGNLKDFLDNTCRQLNRDWPASELAIVSLVEEMEAAIQAAIEIFGEGSACRKWSVSHYERALNRALFDVQIGSLLSPRARDAALSNAQAVVAGHKRLCMDDPAFIRAITSTTKTVEAVKARFGAWWSMFSNATGQVPEWPRSVPRQDSAQLTDLGFDNDNPR